MELKFAYQEQRAISPEGFNRTFMELKSFLDKTNTNMYSF